MLIKGGKGGHGLVVHGLLVVINSPSVFQFNKNIKLEHKLEHIKQASASK